MANGACTGDKDGYIFSMINRSSYASVAKIVQIQFVDYLHSHCLPFWFQENKVCKLII